MISSNGFDNLQWFIGIVENEKDVARQGRVQVRCFGIHPDATTGDVLTEDLPWAPVLNAGHHGTPLPTKGDWVFGAFVDGRDAQHPMVVGVIPGMNAQLPTDSGSSDAYTKASENAFRNYGEPPLPKMQSGEDLETTQLVLQNASLLEYNPASDADGAQKGYPINEPPVPFDTQPHQNAVWKSRNSNSYIQVKEGEGQEHILISHESGSHFQVDKNGNVKIKSFGDLYLLSEGHQFEGGQGAKTLTIDGPYSLKCKNANIEVEGDMTHVVSGDYNLNVGGRFSIITGQGLEVAAQRISMEATTEHIGFKSPEKIKLSAGNNIALKSGATIFNEAASEVSIKSGEALLMESASNVSLKGGANIDMDGAEIHLNDGTSSSAKTIGNVDQPASQKQKSKPVSQAISLDQPIPTTTPRSIGANSIDEEDTGD